MFGGGGGMNPRKMEQMMEQMGIDTETIDAEEIVIRTADGTELVFTDADVTRIDARGQETYQVIGEPEERESTAGEVESGEAESAGESTGIPDDDVELVAARAGVSAEEARAALEATGGDLAAAIDRVE
ncbi:nascent polypeptide-associated complex protein [Salarchaeum sp. III]|uniref:nascent polypeptide-associated complex protein n=1 Tax=Salarchaeum sp. III TaxID=3107927 RepID=UPI002ED836FA